jgi:NhaC family Na+:H+ antiporter
MYTAVVATVVFIPFIATLFICAFLGLPMLYAILAGLVLFLLFGIHQGLPARRLFAVMVPGFRNSMIVVVVLFLIGVMSASWRSSGLMALLVMKGLSLIYPPLFLLFVFLLCSLFSFFLGSSLGSASVMGVLLSTLGNAARVDPLITAGAILSGIYFGDRASYLSSSALLVATINRVDHKRHVRNMLRSSIVPFAASAGIYAVLSWFHTFDASHAAGVSELAGFFSLDTPVLWLPLAIVLLPALTKLKLRSAIVASSAAAIAIAILVQRVEPSLAVRDIVLGFRRPLDHPQLSLLYGGGIVSMVKPMLIVFFSGALPPLFTELGVLVPYQNFLGKLASKTTPFVSALASGILTCAVGCSQTLAIFLQVPLLDKVYPSGANERKAQAIGSTSILISALVPWNIAMAAPLAIIGGSYLSGPYAFFLYLLPLFTLVYEALDARHP